jgi:hypothetical protein
MFLDKLFELKKSEVVFCEGLVNVAAHALSFLLLSRLRRAKIKAIATITHKIHMVSSFGAGRGEEAGDYILLLSSPDRLSFTTKRQVGERNCSARTAK